MLLRSSTLWEIVHHALASFLTASRQGLSATRFLPELTANLLRKAEILDRIFEK